MIFMGIVGIYRNVPRTISSIHYCSQDASIVKSTVEAGQWWHMTLIPALGRLRQADLYEFKAILVYES